MSFIKVDSETDYGTANVPTPNNGLSGCAAQVKRAATPKFSHK
jgi:hypothetical protein